MADEQKTEWQAVYTEAGGDEPIAFFRDGQHLSEFRRTVPGGRDMVVVSMDKPSSTANADVKALFASRHPVAEGAPVGAAAADDVLRAQIRSRVLQEEREKEIETEVRKELAAERKSGDTKPEK